MKKNIIKIAKALLFGAVTVTSVALTSCNDEINTNASTAKTETSADDPFGCGCIMLKTNYSELNKTRIPVNTRDVVITNSNSNFKYTIIEEDGKLYIVPSFTGDTTKSVNDVLTLSSKDGKTTKSILVTLGSEALATRSAQEVDSVTTTVVKALSKGFVPNDVAPLAARLQPIFNAENVIELGNIASGSKCTFLTVEKTPYSNYFYDKATSHNETAQKITESIGFDLTVPMKFDIGIGFNSTSTTTTKKSQDVETAMYGWKTRCASGCINLDYLSKYLDEQIEKDPAIDQFIKTSVSNIKATGKETNESQLEKDVTMAVSLQPIIDGTINEVLNGNSKTKAYTAYDNTLDDMRKLIDKYGMYVSTECQMGGMAQTTLTKSSNSSEMSLEEAIKISFMANNPTKTVKTAAGKDTVVVDGKNRVIDEILKTSPAQTNVKFTYGKDKSCSELMTATNIHFNTDAWGGDCEKTKDINEWKINTDFVKQWVVICFGKQEKNNSFKPATKDNSNFIPIWKLCLDPTRRELLRELIEPDANGMIQYFTYKEKANKTLVVADVKFRIIRPETKLSDVNPFYDYDSRPKDRKMHLYIPMRCNSNYTAVGATAGSVLDLGQWQFISNKSDDKEYITNRLVPFVAYEYVYEDDLAKNNDFTGITNISIGARNGDFVSSGDDSFYMTTGSSNIDPVGTHFLLVKYADDATPLKERFKGVGFMFTDIKGNGDFRNKVFASSIGTDWDPNHRSTQAEFKSFWETNDFVNKGVAGEHHFWKCKFCHWWGSTDNMYPKYMAFPCGTTQVVTRNVEEELKTACKTN